MDSLHTKILKQLKYVIRRTGYRYFPRLLKRWLRYRVLSKPLNHRYRFEPELKVVRQLVTPGTAFIDVGAHTGMYSYTVEDILGSGMLYLFEPIAALHESLQLGFPGAHVSSYALSDACGKAVMHIPHVDGRKYTARSSVRPDIRETGQTSVDEVEIDTISLDEFVRANNIGHIGFIKIDVEGYELAVLHGARATIAAMHPVLQVEIEQRHHAAPIDEIFREIESWGYVGYYIDREKLLLEPVTHHDVAVMQDMTMHNKGIYYPYINNFLFFPLADANRLLEQADIVLAIERHTLNPVLET